MSLHHLPEHQRRLLADALTAGRPFGPALMGGYAIQAHGIVHRPSQDLDFATEHPAGMTEIIEQLSPGGWTCLVVAVQRRCVAVGAGVPGAGQRGSGFQRVGRGSQLQQLVLTQGDVVLERRQVLGGA